MSTENKDVPGTVDRIVKRGRGLGSRYKRLFTSLRYVLTVQAQYVYTVHPTEPTIRYICRQNGKFVRYNRSSVRASCDGPAMVYRAYAPRSPRARGSGAGVSASDAPVARSSFLRSAAL